MYTNKQIIDNQNMFKDEITRFFMLENQKLAKDVLGIESEDEFILKEKEKIINRIKKANVSESINKLFFKHPKRSEEFYVWWDINLQEARILKYVKK